MENFELTRDDFLTVLNEIGINIPRHTKLKTDRLRHRLERCLDAAQRYASLFDNENAVVNPSAYPAWDDKDGVTEGLDRKIWGGFSPDVGTSIGPFIKMCRSIVALGEKWEEGIREVVLTDQEASAIAIQVHSIHCVGENRPLLIVGFATIAGSRKMGIKSAIKSFYAAAHQSQAAMIHASQEAQALLLHLLTQNQSRLSPEFAQNIFDSHYTPSFLIPTSWLAMEDLSRLGKTTGCVVCGEPTRSECGRCQSVQYCCKDCQKKHWADHKHICRALSSGTWHTITLDSIPDGETQGYPTTLNRYDDLGDRPTVEDLRTDARDGRKVPPNAYGDKCYLVKLQMPLVGPRTHILTYDKRRSFKLFIRMDQNPETFGVAARALGSWPRIYRWARRVGDWEWKICFDQEPQLTSQCLGDYFPQLQGPKRGSHYAIRDKLGRSDLLNILIEMHIAIPKETMLKTDRIRHRLERSLDAAQRYPFLFGDENATVNPSDYPLWNKDKDIVQELDRTVIGGALINPEPVEEAFEGVIALTVAMGKHWKQGAREFIVTDKNETGIIIQMLSVHTIQDTRPLILLNYTPVAKKSSEQTFKHALNRFFRGKRVAIFALPDVARLDQALLLHLLKQNTGHLFPDFKPNTRVDKRYSTSFLLPTTWLNMVDIGRLSKTTGCIICGGLTRSYCSGCNAVQYCSKDCQQRHWKTHKPQCRALPGLSSGSWHTLTLVPTPDDTKNNFPTKWVNRYDDLSSEVVREDASALAMVPPNFYGDDYHIVKVQYPVTPLGGKPPHLFIYDRQKSFHLFFRGETNPAVLKEAIIQMGTWPKIYRWAQRVGDWEWRICFDIEPQPTPLW